jgi:hypothetical protein
VFASITAQLHTLIDDYCERLHPGLWAEPLNALSNLAFWLAALLVWRQARVAFAGPRPAAQGDIDALLVMLALIGAGSLVFHTVATAWAKAIDVIFIAVYLHFYLAVYAHRALGWRWQRAWIGIPAFALLGLALAPIWQGLATLVSAAPLPDLEAASRYAAAWSVLVLLVTHSVLKRLPSAWPLVAAAICFVPGLVVRQLDLPLCASWPWGTHFGWHLLNAATLGWTTWAMVRLATVPLNADFRRTGNSSRSR